MASESGTRESDGPAEQQSKSSVNLTGVTETLFIPLVARAWDAESPKPILNDKHAAEVMQKLDYDFGKVQMSPDNSAGVALRTRHFDRWTAGFLAEHPNATVLHLACGLDARAQRVDWGSGVRWIDVDLPEVIELRAKVMATSQPDRDYRLVAASVTEDSWLEEIPADRPTAVVMEGLCSYLTDEDCKALLLRLVERFGHGELLFDCINSIILSAGRRARPDAVCAIGSDFKWACDDPKKLEEIHDGLQLLEAVRYVAAPGVEEFALVARLKLYILSWIPGLRDSARFLRFRFGT